MFSPTHRRSNPGLIATFQKLDLTCSFLDDYFSSFIRAQVDNYLSKIKGLSYSNYVNPQIQISGGFTKSTPNPVLNFLTDPDSASPLFRGTLGVLLAEPGQGKTFMTRYLANEVSSRNFIPLYVHSEQWSRMQRDEISSIWKTIVHSFRHFEAPIGWIDGAEEEFIKVALKAGTFRIIFDGFDEYVLWNKGNVDAFETIESLQSVANETGARILITSRTSFWESEIVANPDASELQQQHIFTIKPFDQPRADNYFKLRFTDSPAKQKHAGRVFSELQTRSQDHDMEFVGRGFFLFLIADLVDRGYTIESLQLSNRTVMQWIMEELCERERTRQKIPFTAKDQIRVFQEFAELTVRGETASTETLRLAFSVHGNCSETEVDETVSRVGKLKDHPLIRLNSPNDKWDFTQEQVRFALIGQRVLDLADPVSGNLEDLRKLATSSVFTPQMQSDVSSAMVGHLFELTSGVQAASKIREMIGKFLNTPEHEIETLDGNLASFVTTLALVTVNKVLPKGSSHLERTATLLSLFPSESLSNLCFSGTLAKFDLKGITFTRCVFNQVTWANCDFDQKTVFSRCRFIGGTVLSCLDFGTASWEGTCRFDEQARSLIQAEAVRSGKRKYTNDNLRADINYLLRKFVPKESLGLRTVSEKHLATGVISASIHKKTIIECLKKLVMARHEISGTDSKGLHIRDDSKEAVIYWATNGSYTGTLLRCYEELQAELKTAE